MVMNQAQKYPNSLLGNYNNWLKVCKLNKSLKEKTVELTNEKDVMKIASINYEFLSTEKERKV